MLRKIAPIQVELGMFIHSLDGNWLEHPFWRSSFVLEDRGQLAELRAARLAAVVIDTERGRDLELASPAPARAMASPARTLGRPAHFAAAPARSVAQPRQQREFGQAVKVADRANRLVSRVFYEARLGRTIKARQIEPVVDAIFSSIQRNPHAFNGLMRCRRDNSGLFQHALAVCGLMVTLARQLRFDPAAVRAAGMAGLLIDVGAGLMQVEGDLCHAGGANPALRDHPRIGYDFLRAGGDVPEDVALACLEHHELCDGTGYPRGMRGQDISRLGRMVAICSGFDDLSNAEAAHGGGLGPAGAIEQMKAAAHRYDRAMLDTFCEAMGLYPVGSVVLLDSQRLGLVVDPPRGGAASPRVRAFFSVSSGQRLSAVDVALEGDAARDAIVGLADPSAYGLVDFPRLCEQLFASAHAG